MHIVYVSDGKAGHRSQALGLFQAMQRQQANATFEEVSINDLPVMSLISKRPLNPTFSNSLIPR